MRTPSVDRRFPTAAGAAFIACLAVAGCATTNQVPYDEAGGENPFFERRVAFAVDEAFHRSPPDCAVVLPVAAPLKVAAMVESALFRHLTGRLPRVIGPLERRRAVRRLAIDLTDPEGRRVLAANTRCSAFVRAIVTDWGDDNVLVWARRRFGLDVALARATDGATLWKARHASYRSDGGLPLSPFSFAFSALEAARFYADGDIAPSLVDDVVRRTVATLPDVR